MKHFRVMTESGSFEKVIKANSKKEAKKIAIERFKVNANEKFEILYTTKFRLAGYLING